MSNIVEIRNAKEAPKSERSSMETLLLSAAQVKNWQIPFWQRELKVNVKVQNLAKEIKADGCSIPGVLTLGRLKGSTALYVVDGQHRIEAFKMSGLDEIIADVRIITFDTMSEMSKEYVLLNSHLKNMGPDDILRGMEPATPALHKIRSDCGWVGYDSVRRGNKNSPMVSMSMLLKVWEGSAAETPNYTSGRTAATIVENMDSDTTKDLVRFMQLSYSSWGRESDNYRLWGGLNLALTMWLYRRLVLEKAKGYSRVTSLTETQFRQCLLSLAANLNYVEWLQGRSLRERDRSAAYGHMKRIFAKRLVEEGVPKPVLPSPAWAG